MFLHQIVQSQVTEVNQLLAEKKFPISDRSPEEATVLLISEVIEAAQEYKRHGMNASREMAKEMVDAFIRAANYWHSMDWNMRDTNQLNQYYSYWEQDYPKDKWRWFLSLILICMKGSDERISTARTQWERQLDLMAGCRVFVEIGCNEDFDALFREVMGNNWNRNPKYNTVEEQHA